MKTARTPSAPTPGGPQTVDRIKLTQLSKLVIGCALLFTVNLTSGCGERVLPAQVADDLPPPPTSTIDEAELLLKRVIERYRNAGEYSDRGVVRLSYVQRGQSHTDTAPLAVSFRRQQSLRLSAYSAAVVISERTLQGMINDPLAGELNRQRLTVKLTDPTFNLRDIYQDPILTNFATAGLGGPSLQLELLLSDQPLAGMFTGDKTLELEEPAQLGNALCNRLVIRVDQSQYRLWVDRESLLIRRVQLPHQQTPLAQDPSITSVQLVLDLENAQWQVPIEETWQLPDAVANGDAPIVEENVPTINVRQFVLPPPPIASQYFGEKLPPFQLTDSRGEVSVSERGSDRPITVLLWIADHPASRAAATQLQAIADQWDRELAKSSAGNQTTRLGVRWLVVMAEPTPPPATTTAAMLRAWNVGLPYHDDFQAIGRDIFSLQLAPALCVLGAQGTLEWYAPGVGPEMSNDLPAILNDLSRGIRIGEGVRNRHSEDRRLFEKMLTEASAAVN